MMSSKLHVEDYLREASTDVGDERVFGKGLNLVMLQRAMREIVRLRS